MQEITEQSIIDKANKLYSIKCTSISEVISHIVEFGLSERNVKKLKLHDLVSLKYHGCEDMYVRIEIESIEGSCNVFKGYRRRSSYFYPRFNSEEWIYDGDVKYICLKLIDDFLENHIIQQKKESILEQKKQQKQKELERKIVEYFVDKFKRKDKPKLWNFLFNWRKQ